MICLVALPAQQTRAEDPYLAYSVSFTDQELDELLAPIALYPDPLLAQMLPAATYPSDIADADLWIQSNNNPALIDNQSWDESVKAIARYPDVLRMMAESMDWTANLGDAFLNQPEDVSDSIQRLRQQARDKGNLISNDKQYVENDGAAIQIVPTQPQYIYVPVYDPLVVYVQRPSHFSSPFVFFGPPLLLGGWLTLDFDWGLHHVVYHGWNRPGWVNHARPYVHVTNVYINKSRPFVRQAWRHDTSRIGPARYLASHPSGPNANRYARTGEIRGRNANQPKPVGTMFGPKGDTRSFSNRGKESRGIVNQQPVQPMPRIDQRKPSQSPGPDIRERRSIPTPKVTQRPSFPSPGSNEQRKIPTVPRVDQQPRVSSPGSTERRTIPTTPRVEQQPRVSSPGSSERHAIPTTPRMGQQPRVSAPGSPQQPAKTPSVSFGGYRGKDEAKTQSVRGQTSRQSSEHVLPSAPPASRESGPGGKGGSGDRQRR
jgi:hypothetical protein